MSVHGEANQSRYAFWAMLLFGAAVCLSHIHQGTLAVDAIRYAYISKTILNTGDWFNLVDGLTGQPYVNKPPLLFWLTASSFQLFGYSTFSAKLPGALASFLALVLLYKLVARRADVRAALFAVALFALTRNFMRSMVDLSFEGIAACGALTCLLGLDYWIEAKRPSIQSTLLVGLGLLLLLMSKPPYIMLAAPAIAWTCFVYKVRPKDLMIFLGLVLFGASWWLLMPKDLIFAAYDNQVALPIREAASPLTNLGMWLFSILKNYPLLGLFGGIGLWRICKQRGLKDPRNTILLIWMLPMLAVFFLIDVRPRYIIVPVLGLTVIAALEAQNIFQKISARALANALIFIAVLVSVLSLLGVRFHQSNEPLLELARTTSQDSFCVERQVRHKEAGQNRMAEMLIELDTGKKVRVYSPENGSKCVDPIT